MDELLLQRRNLSHGSARKLGSKRLATPMTAGSKAMATISEDNDESPVKKPKMEGGENEMA